MASRESIKVLDKKIANGEELYLIHRLGDHKLNAQWVSKDALIARSEQSRAVLQEYDNQLDCLYRQLKNVEYETRRRNTHQTHERRSSPSQKHEMRRSRPRLHHQRQIFEKAKVQLHATKASQTIPASNFVLYINTPVKSQSNWVFGDRLKKISEKQAEQDSYLVIWQNESTSVVKQKDLVERDSRKFCEFWERRLGLTKWANLSQKE